MSTYEKINIIAKFVAERDYDDGYSSYAGLIIAGGGDCWASTDAIIYMSKVQVYKHGKEMEVKIMELVQDI